MPDLASCEITGCSTRQGGHQEAQTFMIQTFPAISFCENVLPGVASSGSSKAGAGLPISGEGTSRGSSLRPAARSATSKAKTMMVQASFMLLIQTNSILCERQSGNGDH